MPRAVWIVGNRVEICQKLAKMYLDNGLFKNLDEALEAARQDFDSALEKKLKMSVNVHLRPLTMKHTATWGAFY